jgi:hypothetical protein
MITSKRWEEDVFFNPGHTLSQVPGLCQMIHFFILNQEQQWQLIKCPSPLVKTPDLAKKHQLQRPGFNKIK